MRTKPPTLSLDTTLLKPGLRLAVGLSGGADSVAPARSLAAGSKELGLVLHAAHLHHGLRGAEADGDQEFARALAVELGLPFHEARVDCAAEAQANNESIEEAARRLRYRWFRQLLAETPLDAIATAHTLDDQAETVLAKFLRGAWTEGLSGIHPVVEFAEGRILRPLLSVTRVEIEAYLGALKQGWREDSSNRHLTYTRNRIRHELLPLLESWNPRLREHLSQMAELARDEEAWWQAEVERIAPQILLEGRPVRGGGRAAGEGLALEAARLKQLAPALQRRLLRSAAERLGLAIDYPATEALRTLALFGKAGEKRELAQGLRAERTPRELRLAILPVAPAGGDAEFSVPIPGEVAGFGVRLRIELDEIALAAKEAPEEHPSGAKAPADETALMYGLKPAPFTDTAWLNPEPSTDTSGSMAFSSHVATLRNWRPGDRVRPRYCSAPRKVKEVLERLKVTGSGRAVWPVLEFDGRIVWMQGVELEPDVGIRVEARVGAVDA